MAPTTPRLRILSVGGNSVSAFLSWRLSATNACDVTLVWKSGFESVSQYGISFRSSKFGNERFKPRHVVRTPEEAAGHSRASFDYVVLCVKALPDVYDLASVIESVVSPQHTCILVNTSQTLGIETYLEQRFPTNVVLSLVSGAEITQLGPSEFEHKGGTGLWVGAANSNPSIPASIQTDMAEALSMTLKSGQVDCEVSTNIRQQQYERMAGPIAFHPASVIFETPSHAELLEKVGVRSLITGVFDELLAIAKAQGCQFKSDFREQTMETMILPAEASSIMYQDFLARRPMEIETFLGSPIKLAQEVGVSVPRIETLYALLHNINVTNQTKPPVSPSVPQQAQQPLPPRVSSGPGPNGAVPYMPRGPPNGPMSRPPHMTNGMAPPRSRAASNGMPPPGMRRGPPPMNGYGPPRMNSNGYNPRGPPQRRPDLEENGLEEFSHVMLYDDMNEEGGYDGGDGQAANMAIRERELALRQKELALREREYNMRRNRVPNGAPANGGYDEDDEDGMDYFDPMGGPTMSGPEVENLDMMSVTSRRTRKAPSAGQLRSNPEGGNMRGGTGGNPWRRPPPPKNRTSSTLVNDMPSLRDQLMNNPLMGYSSDRYGNVDRHNLGQESRTNSLTAERLNELQHGPAGPGANGFNGAYPGPVSRRGSQSPGQPLGPGPMANGRPMRPSPPNGYANGYVNGNGRPSPPGLNMRQPVPRYPPGTGNAVAPQQIEQQSNGVSNLYPPKASAQQVRSLTGSASASAGSGDSNRSAPIDSEPSAHSSASSLGQRKPVGVR